MGHLRPGLSAKVMGAQGCTASEPTSTGQAMTDVQLGTDCTQLARKAGRLCNYYESSHKTNRIVVDWPVLIAMVVLLAAVIALAVVWFRRRRRCRNGPEFPPEAPVAQV